MKPSGCGVLQRIAKTYDPTAVCGMERIPHKVERVEHAFGPSRLATNASWTGSPVQASWLLLVHCDMSMVLRSATRFPQAAYWSRWANCLPMGIKGTQWWQQHWWRSGAGNLRWKIKGLNHNRGRPSHVEPAPQESTREP